MGKRDIENKKNANAQNHNGLMKGKIFLTSTDINLKSLRAFSKLVIHKTDKIPLLSMILSTIILLSSLRNK